MAKAASGTYVFNERKILDASHVVVFCAKTAMDDAWLQRVVDQEEADGRFATPDAKAANHKGRTFFADMHRKELKDDDQWMAKQVYLNVGNFLLGVAAMGLDEVLVGQIPEFLATAFGELDPIYVDVTQSSNDFMRLKQSVEQGNLHKENATSNLYVKED